MTDSLPTPPAQEAVGDGIRVDPATGEVLTPTSQESTADPVEASLPVNRPATLPTRPGTPAEPRPVLPIHRPVAPSLPGEVAGEKFTSTLPTPPLVRPAQVRPPVLPTSAPTPVTPATTAPSAVGPTVTPIPLSDDEDWGDALVLTADTPDDDGDDEDDKTSKVKVKNDAVTVTDRDVRLLKFLARYKYATYPQIADYLGTSVNALRQRFPRLVKAGLIEGKNAGKHTHRVWLPTDMGVRMSELDLPTPQLSWAAVAHTLGLVDIGIRFEALGETAVTEREIRAADTRERPSDRMAAAKSYRTLESTDVDATTPLFVLPLGAGEGHYGHIPDMVLVRQPDEHGNAQSVAIELELNRKPATQWRKILAAYKRCPTLGSVVYYTHRLDVAQGIDKAAAELGLKDTGLVVVRRFKPSEGSNVPLPREGR